MLSNDKIVQDCLNKKFSRLTIIKDLGLVKGRRRVVAICDCGVIKEYRMSRILEGYTKSCGCIRNEKTIQRSTIHGFCGNPLFRIWELMINRCYDPTAVQFEYYGGSGVTVCDEWRSGFNNFNNWAISNGWRIGLELDKDYLHPNDGTPKIYCPEYCCFITHKKNSQNRRDSIRIIYNGQEKCLKEWSAELGLKYEALRIKIKGSKLPLTEAFINAVKNNAA